MKDGLIISDERTGLVNQAQREQTVNQIWIVQIISKSISKPFEECNAEYINSSFTFS